MRADICDRIEISDGGSGGRWPSSRLNRYINQAIQRYINVVTAAGGSNFYSKRTGLLTISTSTTKDANGWAPNEYVPLPSDFMSLIGVDFYYNNTPRALVQFEMAERHRYEVNPLWFSGDYRGPPAMYRIMGKDAAGNQVCKVIPATDSAYQYEIIYVPEMPDLVADSDTFDGRAGFEDFVMYEAAIAALIRNGNTETALYASIVKARDEMEKEMRFKFATIAGPGRRMDTQGERDRVDRLVRNRFLMF
jgi:hypothetical protein